MHAAGTHGFATVNFRRIRRVAAYLGLAPDWIEAEMKIVVRRALERWPQEAPVLLGQARADALLARLDTLTLVQETLA